MARLSGVRPSTESEEEEAGEQSVSAEGVSDSEEEEEGAMVENTPPKRRRLNPDTRHANGNASRSSQQRAMGQEESRETVRGRNAALHSAGQEARQPKGKLKSLGGPLSARRIPLANGNTYDVLDDNEEAVLSNNVRRTPIRRTTKPAQSARKSPDPDQAWTDAGRWVKDSSFTTDQAHPAVAQAIRVESGMLRSSSDEERRRRAFLETYKTIAARYDQWVLGGDLSTLYAMQDRPALRVVDGT